MFFMLAAWSLVLIICSGKYGGPPFPRDVLPRGADIAIFASRCIIVTMEGVAAGALEYFIFGTGWMEIIPPGIVNKVFFFKRWVTASVSE